jgi:repressor LexA
MKPLTPRQQEVLAFVVSAIRNGLPPTRREIAMHFGFRSDNAAEDHLRALAKRGVIVLVPRINRNIRLPDALRNQW